MQRSTTKTCNLHADKHRSHTQTHSLQSMIKMQKKDPKKQLADIKYENGDEKICIACVTIGRRCHCFFGVAVQLCIHTCKQQSYEFVGEREKRQPNKSTKKNLLLDISHTRNNICECWLQLFNGCYMNRICARARAPLTAAGWLWSSTAKYFAIKIVQHHKISRKRLKGKRNGKIYNQHTLSSVSTT